MLLHAVLGLVSEIGEIAGMLKAHIFYGRSIDRVNLHEESGDVMWYMGRLAEANDDTLENILTTNYNKLTQRYGTEWSKEGSEERDLDKERSILFDGYASRHTRKRPSTLVYLASPKNHPDPKVIDERVEAARNALHYMTLRIDQMKPVGIWHPNTTIYSPIVHNNDIALGNQVWADWETHDLNILFRCDELWVLEIDGWDSSVGVSAEINAALQMGIPIRLVTPKSDSDIKYSIRNFQGRV